MTGARDIAKVIEYRMREIGATQREIEHITGLAQSHVSNLLSGVVADPRISTVLRVLKAADLRLVIIDENDGVRYRSDDESKDDV